MMDWVTWIGLAASLVTCIQVTIWSLKAGAHFLKHYWRCVVIWWRPNYYLIFDEESVFHPSSFRRCVRYLCIVSWQVDTGEDTIRADPEVFVTDAPGIQDDVEVDEYLEKVPLLDQETLQESDVEDRSPTPKPPPGPRVVNMFSGEDERVRPYRRMLSCPFCPKTFCQLGQQYKHVIDDHKEKKLYACNYPGCIKRFTLLGSLKIHDHIVHSKQNKARRGHGGNGFLVPITSQASSFISSPPLDLSISPNSSLISSSGLSLPSELSSGSSRSLVRRMRPSLQKPGNDTFFGRA